MSRTPSWCQVTVTITSALIVAVASIQVLDAQDASIEIRRDKTSAGVEFGLWNFKKDEKPSPTLIVLASDIDTTLGKTYYRQCGNALADCGWICVSIDLPCHGMQTKEDEPKGLSGWSHRLKMNDNVVAESNQRLSDVLDHLIESGISDAQQIAVCGTSRGGFLALHFAAADLRVKCAAAFAPVADLAVVNEFLVIAKHPLVAKLGLENQAAKLAGRPVWIVIGDQDQRVGTDRAIALAQKITSASRAAKRDSRVELHVMPEPRGHTTPRGSAEMAAKWILDQFPDATKP